MDTSAFLHYITAQPTYNSQIAHIEHIPPHEANCAELDKPLVASLQDCLNEHGLLPLYTHQAEAVNNARQARNVMIATSSASGKTLCYNIPVLEALLTEQGSRALYLFPTKALAQDQLRGLHELSCPGLSKTEEFATFDGDTPISERAEIRRRARIILTNPDMLHVGILPNHQSWSRLLRHLRYVVVDEAHTYRGVFGSHVACVLRRLRRLCNLYGSNPRFICCSATIANPGEHAERLVGLPFEVIDEDGSPHGGKDFVFWNPPIIDEAKSVRRSANSEATNLFTELVSHNIRSLTFARTRRLTELIYVYSKQRLAKAGSALASKIKAYRAGYLPQERRQIEQELFGGQLLGVVATNALELGIDIGDLEATVLTGYPGSIASTWQQAGRSGRGRDKSLSFLIGLDNPLDQYFMRHPDSFFGKNFENALVNPSNPYILRAHLLCAAWEQPLSADDEKYFGPALSQEWAELEELGIIRERGKRWYLSPRIAYPAQSINIRSTSGENFAIVDASTDSLLETIEASVAFFQVHPGAIYLHQGESYLVEELDLANRTAYVVPTTAPYYTQCKDITDLHVVKVTHSRSCGRAKVYLGEVEVTTTVVGFRKKAQFTEEVIGEEPLDLPPHHFPTVALWFDLPSKAVDRLVKEQLDFAGGLHAAEHAAIAILPLFALCDRNDIGGVSTPFHPDTGRAQIFIYDAYPGGIGIAEKGFDLVEELWQTTLKAITDCPCQEGCPSCIQSPKCGNNNKPLDKKAAQILLEGLLKGVIEGLRPLIKLSSPSPCKERGIKGIGLLNFKTERALKRSRDSWFGRVTRLFDRIAIDEAVWAELEELLISADVGVSTTEKLIDRVKQRVKEEKISQGSLACSALKAEMVNILKIDIQQAPSTASVPRVILVVGVNGCGKTTSIAKLACRSKSEGKSVILAAADTFRAAAIDQLKRLGEMVGVDVVAHQPGADAGAVVFDTLQAARSRQAHEVIIDTAGRLHTKFNLMEELKKIKRVAAKADAAAPHEVILVLDATTGQNGLTQARYFTEAVGITGIFLAKLDGTAKGGIVLAICDELKIPIQFIGVGDKLEDMAPFDAATFVEALFS